VRPLSISEVRNQLPTLVDDVAKTREPILMTRYGNPVAMIVPLDTEVIEQQRYPLRNRAISVSADFDTPLPEMWRALNVADDKAPYTTGKPRQCKKVRKP